MTITTTTNKTVQSGNGSTTSFPFSFLIPNAASLVVTFTDTDGTVTALTSSQYSVAGLGNASGGSVTYPLMGTAIASGTALTILRSLPVIQTTSLINQSQYNPQATESALDYLTMLIQGQQASLSNVLRVPETDPALNELPSFASRAGKFLSFDANGQPILDAMTPISGGSITSVSSFATLRTITSGQPAFVFVLGYLTSGGNGGGIFWWDSSSVLADDGGSVAQPTGVVTGRFRRLIFNSTIYAAGFGIVADSTYTANGTDNFSAITSLIQFLAANPGLIVVWPQDLTAVIGFTSYLQFSHCKNITHIFGSPLRNTGSWNAGGQTLNFGSSIFINHLAGVNAEISRQFPYFISTVAAGSDTVVLITPADAANFYDGQWVAVMGYDQQGGGFPTNYRYVDYRRVKSISGASITLDKPLDHAYYSTWYFYISSGLPTGPAGIQPLDRGVNAQFIDELEIHNLNFLPNLADTPSSTQDGENVYASGVLAVTGCKSARLYNCKSNQLWTGDSDSITINDTEVVEFEPDKNQRNLILNRGHYTRIVQATGVENVEANGTIFKFQTAIASRNFIARKCHYLDNQAPSGINGPVGLNIALFQSSHVFDDCTFDWDQSTAILSSVTAAESGGVPIWPGILSLTVSNDIAPSSSQFTCNYNTGSSGGDGRVRLELGKGTILTRPSDNARFMVKEIEYVGAGGTDAAGYFKVSISSDYTPVNGNVLYYYPILSTTVRNPVWNTRRRFPFQWGVNAGKRYSQAYINAADGYYGRAIDIVIRDLPSAAATNNLVEIDGVLDEIEVVVTNGYGGAGDNRVLISAYTPYGSTFPTQIINTATVGQRFVNIASVVNNNGGAAPAGESLTAFGYNRYMGVINIRPLAADNPGAAGWDGYIKVTATRR